MGSSSLRQKQGREEQAGQEGVREGRWVCVFIHVICKYLELKDLMDLTRILILSRSKWKTQVVLETKGVEQSVCWLTSLMSLTSPIHGATGEPIAEHI